MRPLLAHPSRRGVLAGTALAVGAGVLTACDRTGRTAARTPAGVELTPLETAGSLVASRPVLADQQTLLAGGSRPLAVAYALYSGYKTTVTVVSADAPQGRSVPVAEDAIRLAGYGRPDAAVLLVARPGKSSLSYDLHVSADLATWSTAHLRGDIRRPISAIGDGIVVFHQEDRVLRVARLADDGALTSLTSIDVPAKQTWTPRVVAESDSVIVVAGTRGGASAFAVRSADGGKTWEKPQDLIANGEDVTPSGVAVQQDTFVIVGTSELDPTDVDGTVTYTHPVAFSSADGASFGAENVALPTFELDGYVEGDAPIDPHRPFSNVDYVLSLPSVAGDGTVEMGLAWNDSHALARRAADGTWSAARRFTYLPTLVRHLAADGGGAILRGDDAVGIHQEGAPVLTPSIPLGARRDSTGTGPYGTTHGGGVTAWQTSEVTRQDQSFHWVQREDREWFHIDGDRLARWDGLPTESEQTFEFSMFTADNGTLGIFIEPIAPESTGGYLGARGWILASDGTWSAVTGLPTSGSFAARSMRFLEGTHYLAGATAAGRDRLQDSPWRGALWSSPDAVTWTPVGTFDEGAVPLTVAQRGDELVAGGYRVDDDGTEHAVIFRRSGDAWTASDLGKDPSSSLQTFAVVGGILHGYGTVDDQAVDWTIAADGTVKEAYRASERSSRGEVMDLGHGALLATGWRLEATGGGGAVVWVSGDGGKHWDATPIPGQSGRDDDAYLIRDGADVVVLVSALDGPYGYRIRQAAKDVASAGHVGSASDAGGKPTSG